MQMFHISSIRGGKMFLVSLLSRCQIAVKKLQSILRIKTIILIEFPRDRKITLRLKEKFISLEFLFLKFKMFQILNASERFINFKAFSHLYLASVVAVL